MSATPLDGATEMRRYSLFEIDAMRKSLFAIEFSFQRYSMEPGIFYATTSNSYADEMRAREQRVEDQLRTYMLGGVGPEELAEKAAAAKAEQQAWYEAEGKRIIERDLQKEYGPRA